MTNITYHKGPLGYGVTVDGGPVGRIKRVQGVWMVSVEGFRPGDEGLAGAFQGKHCFKDLRLAKKKIREIFPKKEKANDS